MEHVTHEPGNDEAWICLCGNRAESDGFFPCDKDGNEIESIEGVWKNIYVCAGCGRIINQDSLEIVGQNPNFKRRE
jgi:hypothetical protein